VAVAIHDDAIARMPVGAVELGQAGAQRGAHLVVQVRHAVSRRRHTTIKSRPPGASARHGLDRFGVGVRGGVLRGAHLGGEPTPPKGRGSTAVNEP
jgi:hypothetical protein